MQDNRQYEDCVSLECSCILIAIALYLFGIILMWYVTVLLCSSPVEGGGGGGALQYQVYRDVPPSWISVFEPDV